MVKVDYDTIHKIVDDNENVVWQGWTAFFLKPHRSAYIKKNAMFANDKWNFVVLESNPDDDGLWEVPKQYV